MKKNKLYCCIVVISLIFVFMSSYSVLSNFYNINDDVRQVIYWMYKFQDPELFQDDLVTDFCEFFSKEPIFVAMYYVLIKLGGDPLWIFKLLPFIFVSVSSIFLFEIGKRLKNTETGLILVFLFLVFLPVMNLLQGYYKNLATMLFIIFFYYLVVKKYKIAFLITFLITLFYPIITLICLSILFFSMIDLRNKPFCLKKNKKIIFLFIVTGLLCFGVVQIWSSPRESSKFGRLVTYEEMKNMPEFHEGGRAPILPISLTEPFVRIGAKFILPESMFEGHYFSSTTPFYLYAYSLIRVLFLTGFSMFSIILLKKNIFRFRKEIWFLGLSGVLLFLASRIFFFSMFMPDRYILYSLPLFVILVVSLVYGKVVDRIKNKNIFRVVFVLFFVLFYLPATILASNSMNTKCEDIELYKYIETLPKNVMLAGHPKDMDCIPTFSKRKAYLTYESSHAFYLGSYKIIKERTYKFFDAYYSSTYQEIENFCNEENVDYIVFNRERFDTKYLERGEYYLNPFNDYIKELVRGGGFYFDSDVKNVVYEDEKFVVVEC